jgi:hypothetical protein
MKPDKQKIQEIAQRIEKGYLMGGLSDGLYFDYAYDILCEYLKGSFNVCIGENAGLLLTDEFGVIIIGDNIQNLDRNQKDVLFIGERMAIGETIKGKPNTLYDILKDVL